MTNSDNFGTGVVRTTTARLQQLASSFEGSHTEICDLDVSLSVEEQILRLEIAMTDVVAVAVVDSGDDLLEVVERFVGVESSSRNKIIEQLSSFDVFHDEISAPRVSNRRRLDAVRLTARFQSPRRP